MNKRPCNHGNNNFISNSYDQNHKGAKQTIKKKCHNNNHGEDCDSLMERHQSEMEALMEKHMREMKKMMDRHMQEAEQAGCMAEMEEHMAQMKKMMKKHCKNMMDETEDNC